MRRMTLLEMTQNILSSMNSDEVNSIGDTVESQMVAEEIRNTFYDLYSNRDIAEFEGLVNLESVENEDTPNRLILPDNVLHIKWLKYRNYRTSGNPQFETVDYLSPEEFIRRIVDMSNDNSNYVEVPLLSTSPVTYAIKNNSYPHFYTIFDQDRTLVFDSYDADEESYLTGSNALAWGISSVDFDLEDSFVPPIDAGLFPHFLAEAKSACFINIKEIANSKEEQRARRQLIRSQTRLTKTPEQRQGVFDGQNYARDRGGRSVFRRTYRWGR